MGERNRQCAVRPSVQPGDGFAKQVNQLVEAMIASPEIKPPRPRHTRITVPEIARRLGVGRLTVYSMLEQGVIPAVRIGRQWIITRHAYEYWERTCGTRSETGLAAKSEVMVLT